MTFNKNYLQIDFSDVSTILPIIIIAVVVVALIIMAMLILNRRPSRKSNFQPRGLDFKNYPYNMYMNTEGSPIATVLEMLRRDLEDLSIAHSSGRINKRDYQERVVEIKKTLQDLKELREIIPETKKCGRCNTEILRNASFCDRCGTKQS
ncbi:hypothetical protein [[Eubacterium] cellulosolvens]